MLDLFLQRKPQSPRELLGMESFFSFAYWVRLLPYQFFIEGSQSAVVAAHLVVGNPRCKMGFSLYFHTLFWR